MEKELLEEKILRKHLSGLDGRGGLKVTKVICKYQSYFGLKTGQLVGVKLCFCNNLACSISWQLIVLRKGSRTVTILCWPSRWFTVVTEPDCRLTGLTKSCVGVQLRRQHIQRATAHPNLCEWFISASEQTLMHRPQAVSRYSIQFTRLRSD